MNAVVEVVNVEKKRVGIRVDAGEYVVFQPLDASMTQIGDTISHDDFGGMGRKTYWNETQDLKMRVLVRGVFGSLDRVREQCFVKPEPKPKPARHK